MATTDKRAVVGNATVTRTNGQWKVCLLGNTVGYASRLGDVADLLQPYGNVWALRRDLTNDDTPRYTVPVYQRRKHVPA
jgi:hypothetical protein